MKTIATFALLALTLAACAPLNIRNASSLDSSLQFTPASPLGAKVAGTGKVVTTGEGMTMYRLELQGLPASTNLGAGVYVGSCTNQGQLSFALPNLQSDASGNAVLETQLLTGSLPAKAYVNVHQKTAELGFGAALGCANIR
jgi:hypothetical protein